ncbi:MAG: tRNA (guanosine(37)-N1)-methyltransferase TrmD [Proteobacteria bacterium]|nr:tRNA (guanosine(37)-N1)-methyltransferase TrmD [Pseudomonadota bacterium]
MTRVEAQNPKNSGGDKPWKAVVLTLFPDMFPGPLGHSLAGRALAEQRWILDAVDIRASATDKHRMVDDTPFGGGPGMVMRPDVIDASLRQTVADAEDSGYRLPLIYLTPRGRAITQSRVHELAAGEGMILLCGRFEGIDERVVEAHEPEELSLGDFILSGGEPAAIALIDACVRLIPGVMGSDESPEEESFEQGLLEYPHYTKPRIWDDRAVPDILLSGHHENVRSWRRDQAERITRERRPDLWRRYAETRD